MKPPRALLLVLLGLALGQTELSAGNFRISPVQVFLSSNGSELITIYNEGDHPLRFQITTSSWSQSESGEMKLEATDDILFFPKLLEVAPKSDRKVRVASTVDAGDAEKTYRIFFDELPGAPEPGRGATVAVVTKMGVPIFVTPEGAKPDVRLSASVAAGVATIDARNVGTSYATLQEVRLRGTSADGAEVFVERREGWYLLAGSARTFAIALGETCGDIAKLSVDAVWSARADAEPRTLSETLTLSREACAR